jgi:hypothetical protein
MNVRLFKLQAVGGPDSSEISKARRYRRFHHGCELEVGLWHFLTRLKSERPATR